MCIRAQFLFCLNTELNKFKFRTDVLTNQCLFLRQANKKDNCWLLWYEFMSIERETDKLIKRKSNNCTVLLCTTSDHSDTSHCGPQLWPWQTFLLAGLWRSCDRHSESYTEESRPGDSIFQQRTVRYWTPSPQVREHSLQPLVSHLKRKWWDGVVDKAFADIIL